MWFSGLDVDVFGWYRWNLGWFDVGWFYLGFELCSFGSLTLFSAWLVLGFVGFSVLNFAGLGLLCLRCWFVAFEIWVGLMFGWVLLNWL